MLSASSSSAEARASSSASSLLGSERSCSTTESPVAVSTARRTISSAVQRIGWPPEPEMSNRLSSISLSLVSLFDRDRVDPLFPFFFFLVVSPSSPLATTSSKSAFLVDLLLLSFFFLSFFLSSFFFFFFDVRLLDSSASSEASSPASAAASSVFFSSVFFSSSTAFFFAAPPPRGPPAPHSWPANAETVLLLGGASTTSCSFGSGTDCGLTGDCSCNSDMVDAGIVTLRRR
mmetsp:Transcript_30594/g.91459  ORF Transcript_30594/g.91459 Transcript_30594/m.91459 type:complete len:232 (+) Transcript_30594:2584-3279(+)